MFIIKMCFKLAIVALRSQGPLEHCMGLGRSELARVGAFTCESSLGCRLMMCTFLYMYDRGQSKGAFLNLKM